ncbi:hypothetical protein KR222_010211 [Zaprionus bogoriensis]|nr:hypothetical protein KR222_010211 [Zaprionus bogoriensis]
MPNEVITTAQLRFHRDWGMKILETRDNWQDIFGWYPIQQNKYYKQFDSIYKESLSRYGKEEFKKYAQLRRLRAEHTKAVDEKHTQSFKRVSNYPMDYMANVKVSKTTNGEYGLLPPGHHHYC